jgi:hypothetical protein
MKRKGERASGAEGKSVPNLPPDLIIASKVRGPGVSEPFASVAEGKSVLPHTRRKRERELEGES